MGEASVTNQEVKRREDHRVRPAIFGFLALYPMIHLFSETLSRQRRRKSFLKNQVSI